MTARDCSAARSRFLLGGSGHNAGVINPPAPTSTAIGSTTAMPETAEAWLEERRPATTAAGGRNGSNGWCATARERVKARKPKKAIEPAPGSYVRMT